MKKIALIFILIIMTNCASQKNSTINSDGDMVGIATEKSFLQEPFATWFTKNKKEYKLDTETITKLKPLLNGIKIKAVMGTWCHDSRRETPIFYKILQAADFDMKNLEMITVDRNKKSPNNLEVGLHIERVPTFIFYKNNKEINRFVEYAVETMEKDFVNILSAKNYKNPFAK